MSGLEQAPQNEPLVTTCLRSIFNGTSSCDSLLNIEKRGGLVASGPLPGQNLTGQGAARGQP